MARFDDSIATALRLILKNGQPVTWRSVRINENAIAPWKTNGGTVTDHFVNMVFLPLDWQDRETMVFLNTTNVHAGSTIGLMGQVGFEPSLQDVVIRGSEELRIETLNVLSPNGQKVLYTAIFK